MESNLAISVTFDTTGAVLENDGVIALIALGIAALDIGDGFVKSVDPNGMINILLVVLFIP